ncbi:MAG: polymer-forming cytoskeletal protein [Bacteroidales bacterium]|nr:polymer-forming cytoskeletal protein [Bacteroidales bacterium]
MAEKNEPVNINNISRISVGTECKGTIHSKYDLRIDGTFEGEVYSKGRIVVGETAVIKGDVICDNIDVWGKVEGRVYVKDTLGMKAGCALTGSVFTRRIMVELGSEFNGTCKMIAEDEFEKKVQEIEASSEGAKGTEFASKDAANKADGDKNAKK